MDITFGAWLVGKRGRRGEPGFVSQRDLAERMGVDPTYVSQLEKRTTAPSHDTRRRIHAALGTSDAELIARGILPGPRQAAAGATAREADPLAALIATFTPHQRELLLDLLDRANIRALEEAAAAPPAGARAPAEAAQSRKSRTV